MFIINEFDHLFKHALFNAFYVYKFIEDYYMSFFVKYLEFL